MTKNNIKIVTATSLRADGSMMNSHIPQAQNIKKFLHKNSIPSDSFHMMKQVHGNKVTTVFNNSILVHDACDALVTNQKDTYLGVVTADCVPILFFDTYAHVIGVAHAGYKGILNGVISEVIKSLKDCGANTDTIHVKFGASIGLCCYSITQERADVFKTLHTSDDIFSYQNDTIHLDLQKVVIYLLEKEGIKENNIQRDTVCTQCNKDKYFSYRGDSPETFGTFLNVIGMR
jgi:YfiH family protein